jgi:hypothetical protein
MKESEKPSHSRRSYPAVYEKLIPVALGIIAMAALIAILFALALALRLLPGVTP